MMPTEKEFLKLPRSERILHIIKSGKNSGSSLQVIADTLNFFGYRTKRGKKFTPDSIYYFLKVRG